ncbi:GNAT family N-acetyltransferase [Allorhizocola rhizosphaerae]|uniref:GNAT family N-acetyltransferase n=1 Tax=Allorhizocola rhizosphaerae TaxID=1872709 RepID=UPI000E3CCD29|nr:GNAT family N-acetyltransferase [Allorhizocola rhizosphaerae]
MRDRPATPDDTPAIHKLVSACDPDSSLDSIAADLARPAIVLARDTVVVHDDGELVAWAWVHMGRRAQVNVHPDYRGRGIGTRLLAWAEARSLELGSSRLGQNVPDSRTDAAKLLRANGYEPKATAWLLEIAMEREPEVPALDGITVRSFRDGDGLAAYQMMEKAFNEWQQRPHEYGEWAQQTIERETFVPELSPLAFAGERLVGAVLSLDVFAQGYVERVAVDREFRNRGIARGLLLEAFRGFYRQGRRACRLWTHSDTGALSLYERVGMSVVRSSTHFSKPLQHDHRG